MVERTLTVETGSDALKGAFENSLAHMVMFIRQEDEQNSWHEPEHTRAGYVAQYAALALLGNAIYGEGTFGPFEQEY